MNFGARVSELTKRVKNFSCSVTLQLKVGFPMRSGSLLGLRGAKAELLRIARQFGLRLKDIKGMSRSEIVERAIIRLARRRGIDQP
jgi:hypothetical protein